MKLEPHVELLFLRKGEPVPGDCDLVILPGSKSVIADLQVLKETGWDIDLAAHIRRGGFVLGICGGYQMLGQSVHDPEGVEGPSAHVEGLGYLDIETTLSGEKRLAAVCGVSVEDELHFKGYEMHMGQTQGAGLNRALLRFENGKMDGAISDSSRIAGCYVHGLFSGDAQRASWLKKLGANTGSLHYEAELDVSLDTIAKHIARFVDCEKLLALARVPKLRETQI